MNTTIAGLILLLGTLSCHGHSGHPCVHLEKRCVCREQSEEMQGQMQDEIRKLADNLVQKFEEQWTDAAENLEAASKAFDNLEGICSSGYWG